MRKFLVLATALVLLVGCGGDDSESSQPTTAPTSAQPTPEQDKARAGRIVLTAADLPGYTEDPDSDEDDDDETERVLGGCVQNDPVLTADEPESPRTVEGKEFNKGETQSVSSTATIAETQEQAEAALAQLRNQTVLNCLESGARRELAGSVGPGATVQAVSVSSLPVPTVGDEAVGLRIEATITAQGQTVRVTTDVTAVRRERAVAFLSTTGVRNPFSPSERQALATRMADRMGP
ncbi:MAG TPA: hypothetical protein VHF24_05195 [Acidimicrobiales bacterium]|nr:hypothetical protein [Acidimicrobiales bacterium]